MGGWKTRARGSRRGRGTVADQHRQGCPAGLALAFGAWGVAGGVWWACSRDLALMDASRRDPAGRARARLTLAGLTAVPDVVLAVLVTLWDAARC
jgi:hypothetical protein